MSDDSLSTRGESLSPIEFARVRAIFEAALEQPAGARAAFAAGACVGDPHLLHEVQAMLAADAEANALLDPAGQHGPAPSPDTPSPSGSAPEEGRFPAGTVLAGRYRVLGLLGRGGMGEVYRAHDLILSQTVALKFLNPQHLSEAALARFRNEVRIARQVSHPNVCRVYDLGMVDGLHFLSMEYIDGEDLAFLLRRIGRLPQDKAIEFTRKICAGLGAAHERGVLHRDLKPANIMIDGRGQPRITDFGLAGLAAEIPLSDLRSGTPAYMSPEQKAGKDVTTRSDIYSLGLVLHEMFTGKRRSETQSNPSDLVKDLDPTIERLILRCLDDDPKRRPGTPLNVAMALPGADPVAAALAAGETPSPEMVAASTEKEGFTVRTALGLVAGVVLTMIAGAWVRSYVDIQARVPIRTSPDGLADRAQEFLKSVGFSGEPAPATYGYVCCSQSAVTAVQQIEAAWAQRLALATQRPALLAFVYIQQAQQGPVFDPMTFRDRVPPSFVRVTLDATGRLLGLQATPQDTFRAAATDVWEPLFAKAELDPGRFMLVAPDRVPPEVPFDTRMAWVGDAGLPIRVEAASWQGQPVDFRVLPKPPSSKRSAMLSGPLRFLLPFLIAGTLVLARQNLRHGRSDMRGVMVILATTVSLTALGTLFGPNHVPAQLNSIQNFFFGPMFLVFPVVCALVYIAAEPYVRRHWPDALISWSRLCAGRIRNPLVASHLLIAVVFAELWALVVGPGLDLISGYGEGRGLASLTLVYLGGLKIIGLAARFVFHGLAEASFLLILVVLLRLAIRRLWVADLIAVIIFAIAVGDVRTEAFITLPAWLTYIWLLRRFGLFSFLTVCALQITLLFTPYMIGGLVGQYFMPIHLAPLLLAVWALWVIASGQRDGSATAVS